MDNVDAALKEIDRAITKLGMKGIQTATRVHAEPLDIPKLKPIWEKMAQFDLPIWIHPYHNDKLDWDQGQLSWPFETSTAMYRLVNSKIFDEYPNIKFITHHLGGMIPYFYKRVPRQEAYRNFYGDTAVWGNVAAVMCGYAFFGGDHILFGSDGPFGRRQIQIDSVEWATIPEKEKEKIFTGNALRLLKL
jgi:predicted TIM-barrel fold metal-dependent hydrolase